MADGEPGVSADSDNQVSGNGVPVSIADELTGDLPCIRCGYNLRGLTIRGICPECRVPVRATILAVVDPQATELKPISAPTLTAWALVTWSAGALLAALIVWTLRGAEVYADLFDKTVAIGRLPEIALVMIAVSGVSAITLIRPHVGIPRRHVLRAALGVSAYVPLIMILWAIHLDRDIQQPTPYLQDGGMDTGRSMLRFAAGIFIILIVLGLRPNAVRLAVRSVVVRTGRVDRQSLLALIAAVGVWAAGDAILIASSNSRGVFGDIARSLQLVLITVGSVLFTLGLFGIVLDCWRLRGVISGRGVGLTDILDEKASHE